MSRPPLLLAALLFALPALADEVERPVALVGGNVWIDASTRIEDGVVVFERGLLTAIGPAGSVAIPAGARVVALDGEWIYPAFIDGSSHLGIETVEWPEKLRGSRAGRPVDASEDPPAAMPDPPTKGSFADRSALDVLALGEADGAAHRKAGFGLAVVAPREGYLRGTAVVVALSGRPLRETIVAADVGLDVATEFREKGYPSTAMGRVAHFRQILLDARHARERRAHHERSGGLGVPRPPHDPALEALLPILDGTRPVLFHAGTEHEIRRALALAEEFGLRLVLVGAGESHALVGRLAANRIPVILGLDWPDDPEEARKKRSGSVKGDSKEEPEEEASESPDPDELPPRAREEERRLWEERAATAIALAGAGVPFAFTAAGLGKPAEIHERIARLVAWGLPREAAERALTIGAAEILGLGPASGPLSVGRPATLVVLSGRVGDDKVKARRLYVDGVEFDLEKDASGMDGPPAAGVDVSGGWKVQVTSEDGTFEAGLELAMTPQGEVSGSLKSPMGEATIREGRVSGRRLRVEIEYAFGDQKFEVVLSGRVAEDGTLSGTAELGFDGSVVRWTATRPERDQEMEGEDHR